MTTTLRRLRVNKVAFVDRGAGKGVEITMFKRRDAGESSMPKAKVEKAKTLDEVLEKLDDDEKKLVQEAVSAKKAEDEEEPAEKADDEEEKKDEEAMKRLPASLRKRLAASEAEARAAREEISKLRDEKEQGEFVAKAEALGVGLPGLSTDELATTLRCISKRKPLGDELAAKVEEAIAKACKLLGESELLKERGSSAHGKGADTAIDELNAVAKKLKETDPTLSQEQAFAKAYDLNPDLVRRYDAELRGA